MKRWIKILLIFLFFLFILFYFSRTEKVATVGMPAPDFSLKDLDGKEYKLSQFRGKVVFLNFWATWCPPCRSEIPSMNALNERLKGDSFVMMGVSIDRDSPENIKNFSKEFGVNFLILHDRDGKVAYKRYGITGVPETFIIDKKGVLVKKIIGAIDWSNEEVIKEIVKYISES
ncbi:MAG: TlpA disulfide reductase family protein [Candidatus Aenigmatarchaeota archaeon]